jgi:8-oxo-dGTP pyrophosphatase MutT (NUDIX family)
MSLHADATAVLEAWRPSSARQEELRRRYVDHLAANADGVWRSCRPDHLTASTLVLSADASAVLLTLHAKARRWFQFGGHCEPDDVTLLAAAAREATEETGIASLAFDPVPIHLDAHDVAFCGSAGATHLDVRFLAVAPADAEHAVSEESLAVRWWPIDSLPTDEPTMTELVAAGLERLSLR